MTQERGGKWTEENIDRLRKKIHERGEEFLKTMMVKMQDGQNPYDLDFTGREALAERIGKEFASMLLQENLQYDLWREIVQDASCWKCPRCGENAPSHKDEDGNDVYEEAELKTKVGAVRMKLRQFRCGKCRKIFSPLPTEN